ncbi:MAG: LamG domain-containing protein, partial [Planctomycetes bacterium]|nr:LamG domain-containing protein [Planctomycetota bacterium]
MPFARTNRFLLITALLLYSSAFLSYASIKSNTGIISFDADSLSPAEASLSSNGLMIGSSEWASANLEVSGNTIISKQLFVGCNSGSSNLNLSGTIGLNYLSVSDDTAIDYHSLVLANTASNNIEITLPYAANVSGRILQIKKTSPLNTLTVSGGGNFIDNIFSVSFSGNRSQIKLISSGTQWMILSTSESEIVPGGNLIGYWKLNESTGSTIDDATANHHNGITAGGLDLSSNTITGQIGSAISFDGVNDRISIAHSEDLNPSVFSIAFWVKKTSEVNDWARVMEKKDNGAQEGWSILFETNKRVYFNMRNDTPGATQTSSINSNLAVGEWRHYVYTFNGSIITAYENGIKKGTVTMTGNYLTSTEPLILGSKSDGSDSATISLDEVQYYNRVLSL